MRLFFNLCGDSKKEGRSFIDILVHHLGWVRIKVRARLKVRIKARIRVKVRVGVRSEVRARIGD
jgi:hypothetical protein